MALKISMYSIMQFILSYKLKFVEKSEKKNTDFRAPKLSKLVRFKALNFSKVESFRALKSYHPKTLKEGKF